MVNVLIYINRNLFYRKYRSIFIIISFLSIPGRLPLCYELNMKFIRYEINYLLEYVY